MSGDEVGKYIKTLDVASKEGWMTFESTSHPLFRAETPINLL